MLRLQGLWRKQHHLEQNGYASHEEWQQDWRDVRSNEFFVLGSRDETAGCQLCVAAINDDGTLTCGCGCRIAWRNRTASIWWFQTCGLLLGMMWCWLRWGATPSYAVYRRKHGEQEARATRFGQAISYRFKRDAKGWRVFVRRLPEVEITTDRRRGAIGVDLNADHLAVAETDASGNYVKAWRVPLVTYGN